MTDYRFSKRIRLLRASEFERVFAARSSASDPWVAMYGVANELDHARIGITVSRKIGIAVVRNRWKRRLREAFRQLQHQLPALDIVCVARTPTPPTLNQLLATITDLTQRIETRLQRAAGRTGKDST